MWTGSTLGMVTSVWETLTWNLSGLCNVLQFLNLQGVGDFRKKGGVLVPFERGAKI